MQPSIQPLLEIAVSLTQSISAADRYHQFLGAIRQVIPCDAAALMRLQDGELLPLAAFGLSSKAMQRTYAIGAHPRLAVICESTEPVIFPSQSNLPDPFDHLLGEAETSPGHVHSCMGCPLTVDGRLVGVLTADALQPGMFDDLDHAFLKLLGALAGSAMHTSGMIEALEQRHQRQRTLTRELMRAEAHRAGDFIGTAAAVIHLRRDIADVAGSDLAVLVQGESGVGKELVARAIHQQSQRAERPLIYLNCAALPEQLAESELFGHLRGAFTGAVVDRPGKFEIADGGTLFLDEVGELPLGIQATLLRALQEGEIQRVGADRVQKVNVRVIAATNRDLAEESRLGRFRLDLYHRLNVYPITVPPLRERLSDVPLLVRHFAHEQQRLLGLDGVEVPSETQVLLQQYAWPGNIRELKNMVSRAVLRARGRQRGTRVTLAPEYFDGLDMDWAAAAPANQAPGDLATRQAPLRERVDAFQRACIEQAVAAHAGNWSQAAASLGLNRSNLHHLAKRLGLK